MNQADMNICCRSLCGICFQLSWENTYSGIARTYGKFMFNIKKKNAKLFSEVVSPFCNSTRSV